MLHSLTFIFGNTNRDQYDYWSLTLATNSYYCNSACDDIRYTSGSGCYDGNVKLSKIPSFNVPSKPHYLLFFSFISVLYFRIL